MAVENLPERPLRLAIADLESPRQRPRELSHAVVQQRYPDLETHRHADAIDLCQQVIRQIPELIGEHHAIEQRKCTLIGEYSFDHSAVRSRGTCERLRVLHRRHE